MDDLGPEMFEMVPYKDTGVYILKASEDPTVLLEDEIIKAEARLSYREKISLWQSKLTNAKVT